MKIGIFTPTYYRFGKTKLAIESIIKSIELSVHEVMLHIGDNNTDIEEMQQWLDTLTADKIKVFKSKVNVGKAAIVNQMFNESHKEDFDYFISVDSDLVVENAEMEKYCWIDEMVKILEADQNIGVVSTFQDGANCHAWQYLIKEKVVADHTIKFGSCSGIAGGCIMLRASEFVTLGGYQARDLYAGDDALLLWMVEHNLKKLPVVVMDVKLTHIPNEDTEGEYQEWKKTRMISMQQDLRGSSIPNFAGQGFYDKKE